jgi:hypothetical protein
MKRLMTCVLAVVIGWSALFTAAGQIPGDERVKANNALAAGNVKDAYETYQKLAIDPADAPDQVSHDLLNGIMCLVRLQRADEVDAFRDDVIAAHGKNWRLLQTAAQTLIVGDSSGALIAGKFYRGPRRANDGQMVDVAERDRALALQLMAGAIPLAAADADKAAGGEFFLNLAGMLLHTRSGPNAWRLGALTDLSKLPDYSEYDRSWEMRDEHAGAPVNPDGSPAYHTLPPSWEAAKTDGQRWRWTLQRAAQVSPALAPRSNYILAEVLRAAFDVEESSRDIIDENGTPAPSVPSEQAVRELPDNQTFAHLVTGLKRITLPDEFNYIKLFESVAASDDKVRAEQALTALAQIRSVRHQYDRAAELWKQSIDRFGPGEDKFKEEALHQIQGNWVQVQPAGQPIAGADAPLILRFRNGHHVHFEANEIDLRKVVGSLTDTIKAGQMVGMGMSFGGIGMWIMRNGNQLIGAKIAEWDLDVEPLPGHLASEKKIAAPLKKAGLYIVTAKMSDGNSARTLVSVMDTVIVRRPSNGGMLIVVADARSGAPVAGAKVTVLGYRPSFGPAGPPGMNNGPDLLELSSTTDDRGVASVSLPPEERNENQPMPRGLPRQWLITADQPGGHFAYQMPFNDFEFRPRAYQDGPEKHTTAFLVTDRPVYRPGQVVHFKAWIAEPRYDMTGDGLLSKRTCKVTIQGPHDDKLLERDFTTDDFGGIDGQFTLPPDATLGVYSWNVEDIGSQSFTVEEYKKPEFEVTVEAPAEPIALGQTATATIRAKYYFGAPVGSAKVTYHVERTIGGAGWSFPSRWDWLFGAGYEQNGPNYAWWPGWKQWGHPTSDDERNGRGGERRESILNGEATLDDKGTLSIPIDTAPAREQFGDEDVLYTISAQITDESRRMIMAEGKFVAAGRPFRVYTSVDRGYYTAGDTIQARFNARTADGKPVKGKGQLKLLKVSYRDETPIENAIETWDVNTDEDGAAHLLIKAAQAGQYRLSYTVTDARGRAADGASVLLIRDAAFDGRSFRFNDIEVIVDQPQYAPGDTVRLMINSNHEDASVLLFIRPVGGVYPQPRLIHLKGKSTIEQIAVAKTDMPNFFVEAMTIHDGKTFAESCQIIVPPENRAVHVEVLPDKPIHKPDDKATLRVRLTDDGGKPVVGSAVVTIYDKAVEYIADASNIQDIKTLFWGWKRDHFVGQYFDPFEHRQFGFGFPGDEAMMDPEWVARLKVEEAAKKAMGIGLEPPDDGQGGPNGGGFGGGFGGGMRADVASISSRSGAPIEPIVRNQFADTALWVAAMTTDANGVGQVELKLPQNLTTWKARVWTMAPGVRVGEGSAEFVTTKDLLVRLQAPRFFVEKDQVTISANVHNYLHGAKDVTAVLAVEDLDGALTSPLNAKIERHGNGWEMSLPIHVEPGAQMRVDWPIKIERPGRINLRVKALSDEESDAMEMAFPVYIHGAMKTESFSGALRADQSSASLTFNIPADRKPEQSRVEIHYSPSVAAAMVDALPYLADYPYGCTEQTLNRYLPAIVAQRTLKSLNLNLEQIRQKRANLNAQELGDPQRRAADWARTNSPNPDQARRNPVFNERLLADMAAAGRERLMEMRNGDGGWGWFAGAPSDAHCTALIVQGLQLEAAGKPPTEEPDILMTGGVDWLKQYQAEQLELLKNFAAKRKPAKQFPDDLDALVFATLVQAKAEAPEMDAMRDRLFNERNRIGVRAKALLALACERLKDQEKLKALLENLSQYVVRDDENQTAWLRMPPQTPWWTWYGSDIEADAAYLKLLTLTEPKGETTARLAKYIINNRKNATFWNSTRDTAECIEALSAYLPASGEGNPDMTVAVLLDGRKLKDVKIDASNLFSFDGSIALSGADVTAGSHRLEFQRTGKGPLYFNAYVSNFSLEDPIKKAGLEVRVERKFYKLTPTTSTAIAQGVRGQIVEQQQAKYDREELKDAAAIKSGDLIEVELSIDSKNDYEYILIEDMKAAGFGPAELLSGYDGNELGAYAEFHDDRVSFFCRTLARGQHSVSYRLWAQTPGQFGALPARISAMYAPELTANSDEAKLRIEAR